MIDIEEWRDIIGYLGIYQVSNLGRVKSINCRNTGKENILKGNLRNNGYYQIGLSKEGVRKTFKIHQLVCQAFNSTYFVGCGKDVNHIDGNRLNNKANNLEPRTRRENSSSICFRNNQDKLTSQYDNVCWVKRDKKWKSYIQFNGLLYNLGFFDLEIDAANESKIALNHINNNTFEGYVSNKVKNNIKPVNQYTKSGEFIRSWNKIKDAEIELIISRGSITKCCTNKLKSAGGYKWEYSNNNLKNIC